MNRRDLRRFLQEDLAAYIHHRQFPARRWRLLDRLRYPVIGWQRLLRRTEYAVNTKRGGFWKLYVAWRKGIFLWTSLLLNLEIPLNVFGPGLTVAHHGSIVIHPDVRAGARCRIHPGTCIGIARERAPVMGDDIYLGNGSLVAGGIEIGSRAVIGPHALVRHSVEDDARRFAQEAQSPIRT